MNRALEGIKVLDFSQLLAGPYAAMMLGDLGADVIKIERLGTGDLYRDMTFFNKFIDDKVAPTFLAWNRNKRSIAMNIKTDEAKAIIYTMVKEADIVIHNFRPGVMDRLGYGYKDLKQINPSIIYGSNSGYGPDGPYSSRPGQDLLIQGLSGLMSLTGRHDSPPTPLGTGLADHLSAYHLVYGIMGALFHRTQTGIGQEVEVDLYRSILAFQNQELTSYLNLDVEVSRPDSGIALPNLDAPYGVYQCSDGYISIAMNDYSKLVQGLGDESLLVYDSNDIRYDKRDEIFYLIEAITKTETVDYWLNRLLSLDLWVAKVNHIKELEKDPQVKHMGTFTSYEHPEVGEVKTVGPAITLSETPADIRLAPPTVGQHSEDILLEYGFSHDEIAGFYTNNIIG